MANLIDAVNITQNLGFYATVFPFLLIFAVTYGLLSKFKPFGESKGVNVVISMVMAFIFISFTKASLLLQNLMPFISTFLLILFFLILIFMFLGVKESAIAEFVQQPEGFWAVIGVVLLSFIIAIAVVFPEFQYASSPELAPANYTQTAQEKSLAQNIAIILHPTILGMLIFFFILAIGAYVIVREKVK